MLERCFEQISEEMAEPEKGSLFVYDFLIYVYSWLKLILSLFNLSLVHEFVIEHLGFPGVFYIFSSTACR